MNGDRRDPTVDEQNDSHISKGVSSKYLSQSKAFTFCQVTPNVYVMVSVYITDVNSALIQMLLISQM